MRGFTDYFFPLFRIRDITVTRNRMTVKSEAPPAEIDADVRRTPSSRYSRIGNWRLMIVVWLIMIGVASLALKHDVDKSVVAGGIVVFGLLSNAFAWMLGVIALVPIIGPLIAKVLSAGFIWVINAIGYFVSIIAIRRGYAKDVLTYRGMTIALIIGVVIGFVLGKLV